MFKYCLRIFAAMFVFALALGLQSPSAQAQDQTYYTYVSFWAVPRAQWAAFAKEREQQNGMLQKLVADGTIVSWGNDEAYVHEESGYTHEDWFTSATRAGILKALDGLRTGATGPAFASVTKHEDIFLHTLAHGGKTASGATGYIRVADWQVKPGEGEDFVAHFMRYLKPKLDAMVENGSILMYNFDTEDLHTTSPGEYDLAILFPSGEAMDAFYTKLEANSKDDPAVGEMIGALTVGDAHRDSLGKVTSYQHK